MLTHLNQPFFIWIKKKKKKKPTLSIIITSHSPWSTPSSVPWRSYDASGRQVGHCSFIVMMSQEHLHTCNEGDGPGFTLILIVSSQFEFSGPDPLVDCGLQTWITALAADCFGVFSKINVHVYKDATWDWKRPTCSTLFQQRIYLNIWKQLTIWQFP